MNLDIGLSTDQGLHPLEMLASFSRRWELLGNVEPEVHGRRDALPGSDVREMKARMQPLGQLQCVQQRHLRALTEVNAHKDVLQGSVHLDLSICARSKHQTCHGVG